MKSPKEHPPEQALLDFAAGTLKPDVATSVGAHVRSCPTCSGYVSTLSDKTAASGGLSPEEIEKARSAALSNEARASRTGTSGEKKRGAAPAAPPREQGADALKRPSVLSREPSSDPALKRADALKRPSVLPREPSSDPALRRASVPPRTSLPPREAAGADDTDLSIKRPDLRELVDSGGADDTDLSIKRPVEPALPDALKRTSKVPRVSDAEVRPASVVPRGPSPFDEIEETKRRQTDHPEEVGFARTNLGKSSSQQAIGDFDPSKTSDDLLGSVVGDYKIIDRLGQGGMGTVYRAEHALIGKPAAVKVMLQAYAGDSALAQRMLSEARAVNAIRHPNIVDVFAFGQLPDGRPYLVMELLSGRSLADHLIQNHSLSVDRALHVLVEALAALEAAHAVGVVHRDLKPDNIFIDPSAKPWKVKLLDFGLAKTEGALDARLTRPGAVMGTPGYMAPEQVRSADAVSPKTDVYAMGVVAWAALAGREPFHGKTAVEIMHQHLTVPAPPLGKAADDIPPALDALVNRMLAKDPDQRPTAAQARAEMEAIRKGPVAAPAPPPPPKAALPVGLIAGGVLALLAVLVGAFVYFELSRPPVVVPPDQPLDTRLKPLPKPKPTSDVIAEAPVDAGQPVVVATPPKGEKKYKTWPCDELYQLSPVLQAAAAEKPYLVEVKFLSLPNVLLAAKNSNKERVALQKFSEQLNGCKKDHKLLMARIWEDGHGGYFTTNMRVPKGTLVWLDKARLVASEEEAEEIVAAEAQEGGKAREMRWPCDKIYSVDDPLWTIGHGYRLVLVKAKGMQNLIVVTDSKPANVAALDKVHKAIVRCQGGRKVLSATSFEEHNNGYGGENFTHATGVRVYLQELSIKDP